MYKILLFLTAITTFLFSSDMPMRTGEFPQKEMKKQNITIAKHVAKALSKDLPHTIDKYTKLVTITSNKATLIWTFEINTGAKSDKAIKNEDHSKMKKIVRTGVCQSSSKFLKAGIDTTYIYISAKTKAELFRFNISQKDCIGI